MSQVPEKCQGCSSLEKCQESGFFDLLSGFNGWEKLVEGLEESGDLGSLFSKSKALEIHDTLAKILGRTKAVETIQRAQVISKEAHEAFEAFGEDDLCTDDVESVGTMGLALIDFVKEFGLQAARLDEMLAAAFSTTYHLGYIRAMKNVEEAKSDGS